MSERSSVSISEILGDNYYIDKLTSNDYSPSVGDTVTITISVNDVFGDPANGQSRTVTCTSGQFVSMNGTGITASSSVDVTTGSGGTVTLGLSVSVADNIIVSDGRVECVVSSLSTSIKNWSTANFDKATVYYNDYFVYVSITQESNTSTVPTTYTINIGSTYAPPSLLNIPSYAMYNGIPYAFARFNTNGAIEVTINRSTYNSSGGLTLTFGVLYPRI